MCGSFMWFRWVQAGLPEGRPTISSALFDRYPDDIPEREFTRFIALIRLGGLLKGKVWKVYNDDACVACFAIIGVLESCGKFPLVYSGRISVST